MVRITENDRYHIRVMLGALLMFDLTDWDDMRHIYLIMKDRHMRDEWNDRG